MLPEKTIIFEYQEILLKHQSDFKVSFKCTEIEKYKVAGIIWRYAITELLEWTADEAVINLTPDLVSQLCLDKTYLYIGFKEEAKNMDFDYKQVLQYAFPKKIKFNVYQQTIETYQKVMHLGQWQNDTNIYQYPKKFFLDSHGTKRAAIALNYAITCFLPDLTVPQLYDFFSNRTLASKWLREKKLIINVQKLYLSPLDYFHFSIPSDMRDQFEYNNAVYRNQYEKLLKERKLKQKQEKLIHQE